MNLLKAQLVEKAGPIMAKSSAVAEKIVKLRSTLVSAKHETRDGKFVEVLADADERLLLDSNVVAMTSGAGRIDLTKYAKDYSRSFKLGDLEKHSKVCSFSVET
jgi:ABC-type taurine transport system ATPase subunit